MRSYAGIPDSGLGRVLIPYGVQNGWPLGVVALVLIVRRHQFVQIRPQVQRTWAMRHERRVVHFNVTAHPTAAWTAQQIVEAFPEDTAPGS